MVKIIKLIAFNNSINSCKSGSPGSWGQKKPHGASSLCAATIDIKGADWKQTLFGDEYRS